jgi:hypothetical protein
MFLGDAEPHHFCTTPWRTVLKRTRDLEPFFSWFFMLEFVVKVKSVKS